MNIISLPMYYGADPVTFSKAQELRSRMTIPEKHLWDRINNNQLRNLKFRRQHPIGIYIVDFYCHPIKLVVEIDGKIHLQKEVKENDKQREENLKSLGLKIIRFKNEEILEEIDVVIEKLLVAVESLKNNPPAHTL